MITPNRINYFKNFLRLKEKFTFLTLIKYYLIKLFPKLTWDKEYEFKLQNNSIFNIIPKAGDFCVIHEVFIKEDYKVDFKKDKQYKILDIGANIGCFSVYMAKQLPLSKIYCFEPFKPTYDELLKNIKKSEVTNVKSFPLAVSDKEEIVDFYSIEWRGCNTLIPGKFDEDLCFKDKVKSVPLAECLKLAETEYFDLAKIDCEGSEYQIILNTDDDVLRRIYSYIIEVHLDKKYSANDIIYKLGKLNYDVIYDDNILRANRRETEAIAK